MRLLLLVLTFLISVAHGTNVNSAWHSHGSILPLGISDAMTVAVAGRIYLAGGCTAAFQATAGGACLSVNNTMWMLDVDATRWTPLDPMPRRRYRYAAAAVGPNIYYIGGRVSINETQGFDDIVVPEIDVFNTVNKRWSTLPTQSCNCTSISDAAAFVIGKKLYVTGGYSEFYDLLNSTLVIDTSVALEQQQFQPGVVAQRTWAAGDLGAVTVNDVGYVMGGFSTDFCYPISLMSSYGPATNKWTDLKPFVHRRGDFAFVTIGQYIYVIGGETKAAGCTASKLTIAVPVADVERYDTKTGEWLDYAPIAIPRFRFAAVAVDDEILDIGGQGEASNNVFPLIPDIYVLNVTEYEIARNKKNDAVIIGVSIVTFVAIVVTAFL